MDIDIKKFKEAAEELGRSCESEGDAKRLLIAEGILNEDGSPSEEYYGE